jgi:hypothetical protein
MAHSILNALPENTHCKIVSFAETESQLPFENFSPPDLLIVDFASARSAPQNALAHLTRNFPELTVIVIAPIENFRPLRMALMKSSNLPSMRNKSEFLLIEFCCASRN